MVEIERGKGREKDIVTHTHAQAICCIQLVNACLQETRLLFAPFISQYSSEALQHNLPPTTDHPMSQGGKPTHLKDWVNEVINSQLCVWCQGQIDLSLVTVTPQCQYSGLDVCQPTAPLRACLPTLPLLTLPYMNNLELFNHVR